MKKGYLDSYQLKEHVNLRTYIYHLEQKKTKNKKKKVKFVMKHR